MQGAPRPCLLRRSSSSSGPAGATAAAARSAGVVGVAVPRRRCNQRAPPPPRAGKHDGPTSSGSNTGSSGGGSGKTASSRTTTTTATGSSTSNASTGGPRPPPRRGSNNSGGASAATRMGELLRSTPVLNRFADGTLVLGDAVMVASTQLSSERIPWDEAGPLLAVSVAAWVLAAAARGDYLPDKRAEYDDPLSLSLGFPVLIGIADACVTWAVAVVPAIGADAWLAARFLVNPLTVAAAVSPHAAAATSAAAGTFARGAAGPAEHMLSPELEVLVALLITMSSWRGIAAWLRLSGG